MTNLQQVCASVIMKYVISRTVNYLYISLYRLQKLKKSFIGKYEESPLFYACAPGRVNLIGWLSVVHKFVLSIHNVSDWPD